MRARDWVVALSVSAVLGVLLGGVYSGITRWTGPSGRAAAATGPGLPLPGERASTPAAPAATTPAVRPAPARTAAETKPVQRAKARHKVKPKVVMAKAKAKAAK